MPRTALTIFGALLISGSVVQMAAASEHHHHMSKAYFGRHVSEYRGAYDSEYRGAYDWVNGPVIVSVTRGVPDRFDPSVHHNEDPILNPPD